jgi:hypothetical protein
MTNPRRLTEDLPQMEDELRNPAEMKRVITEDLPQEEDEEPDPKVLTEDQ